MGASTTAALIAKGKAENDYNNSGIRTDAQWVDFFNDALTDLVEDLNIEESLPTVSYVTTTREYAMPANFYSLSELINSSGLPVSSRRHYSDKYPAGYFILNKGGNFSLDLYGFGSDQTFTGLYVRYPATLTAAGSGTEKPEVPSIGERALVYYAIAKALRNNNQTAQAQELEKRYESERKKIRMAMARSREG